MPTPGQAFSAEHSRVFVLVPPPQVAEHSENDDHSDHWGTNRSPSEKVVKIVVVSTFVFSIGSSVGSTVVSVDGSVVGPIGGSTAGSVDDSSLGSSVELLVNSAVGSVVASVVISVAGLMDVLVLKIVAVVLAMIASVAVVVLAMVTVEVVASKIHNLIFFAWKTIDPYTYRIRLCCSIHSCLFSLLLKSQQASVNM